jgi:hypothetical protein
MSSPINQSQQEASVQKRYSLREKKPMPASVPMAEQGESSLMAQERSKNNRRGANKRNPPKRRRVEIAESTDSSENEDEGDEEEDVSTIKGRSSDIQIQNNITSGTKLLL